MMMTEELFKAAPEFQQDFARKPFLFKHDLSGHELFTHAALKKLVERVGALPESSAKGKGLRPAASPGFFVSASGKGMEWGTPEFQHALNLAFENLDSSSARIKLSSIHKIPEYRTLLNDCARSLSEVTGIDFARTFLPGLATLFISSPGQITPYHVDSEINLLLQIHGKKKTVYIANGDDRSVVKHTDIENFWTGKSYLKLTPEVDCKVYELTEGQGIHNPPFFPHWVENGPNASISLSLGFDPIRSHESEVYRMNAYMRKLGLKPKPPGANVFVDQLKSVAIHRALQVKRATLGA
jgi:hypothetical protein